MTQRFASAAAAGEAGVIVAISVGTPPDGKPIENLSTGIDGPKKAGGIIEKEKNAEGWD